MTDNHRKMIEDLYNQCSQEQKEKYDKKVGIMLSIVTEILFILESQLTC